MRIAATSSPIAISVEVENPTIVLGTLLSQFLRLTKNAGTFNVPRLVCREVNGLGSNVQRVANSGTVGISESHMDSQSRLGGDCHPKRYGCELSEHRNCFPFTLPDECRAAGKMLAIIGGDWWEALHLHCTSITNTGFNITTIAADAVNFANTTPGNALWVSVVRTFGAKGGLI